MAKVLYWRRSAQHLPFLVIGAMVDDVIFDFASLFGLPDFGESRSLKYP
jgi:hypothetical protein